VAPQQRHLILDDRQGRITKPHPHGRDCNGELWQKRRHAGSFRSDVSTLAPHKQKLDRICTTLYTFTL
jgi:hypothetical protein